MQIRRADAAVVVRLRLFCRGDSGCLFARLLQRRRLAVAALARRGADPPRRHGVTTTGVSVMRMEEGLDTGPIGMMERVHRRRCHDGRFARSVVAAGADLMLRAIGALERGSLQMTPQPAAGVTYAKKIDKARHASTGSGRGTTSIIIAAGCRRSQARGVSFPASAASRFCVPRRAPAAVFQARARDKLTVACGDGAVRTGRSSTRGTTANDGGGISSRHGNQSRHRVGLTEHHEQLVHGLCDDNFNYMDEDAEPNTAIMRRLTRRCRSAKRSSTGFS